MSTIRFIIWKFLRLFLILWNLVEIGCIGKAIFTRVFIIFGKKP